MKLSTMPWMAAVLHLALAGAPTQAQRAPAAEPTRSQPTGEDIEAALARFRKLSPRNQEKALAAVRAAVEQVDDPYLRSIRAAVARLAEDSGPRPAKLPKPKTPKKGAVGSEGATSKGDPTLWQQLAFPVREEYVFGRGCIVACNPVAGAKSSASKRAAAEREAELRALLYGFPPDLDMAIASLLWQLDRDRGADTFCSVLETWRDGDESFYRALDRTAGTQDSLFFYDAMLADFLRECVAKSSPDYEKLHASNVAAHDALHESFLAYRQYRGLREAAVLSLLLPPDQRLPGPLARYERDQPGGYSLREVVTLLLADADQDVENVARLIASTAPPLPGDLWRGYEPLGALHAAFNERQESMIEKAGHTAELLKQQTARRAAMHDRLARVAYDALLHGS